MELNPQDEIQPDFVIDDKFKLLEKLDLKEKDFLG